MPRGKLGAPKPKGTRQGKPLSDMEKEIIRQTQMITQNKAETARQMGVGRKTVDRVLKGNRDEDPAVIEARRQSAIALAGKVHGKIDNILNSIGPEDLETGREIFKDENGKVTHVVNWGPSLMQKVTAGAIFVDKLPVLAQYEQAITADHETGALPLPSDIDSLVAGVKGKVESLSILNVRFREDNPVLASKVQDAIVNAEIVESTKETEPLDFDNPGVVDAGIRTNSDNESG